MARTLSMSGDLVKMRWQLEFIYKEDRTEQYDFLTETEDGDDVYLWVLDRVENKLIIIKYIEEVLDGYVRIRFDKALSDIVLIPEHDMITKCLYAGNRGLNDVVKKEF